MYKEVAHDLWKIFDARSYIDMYGNEVRIALMLFTLGTVKNYRGIQTCLNPSQMRGAST